mmetsp:Transcript_165806/g.527103  ORF Transcript_165806/g.527103 Transcript_165806/m.527103 type:complete len:211 (-) Transcript_165806:37-669(-)
MAPASKALACVGRCPTRSQATARYSAHAPLGASPHTASPTCTPHCPVTLTTIPEKSRPRIPGSAIFQSSGFTEEPSTRTRACPPDAAGTATTASEMPPPKLRWAAVMEVGTACKVCLCLLASGEPCCRSPIAQPPLRPSLAQASSWLTAPCRAGATSAAAPRISTPARTGEQSKRSATIALRGITNIGMWEASRGRVCKDFPPQRRAEMP